MIARLHNLEINLYAADSQLYVYFWIREARAQWEVLHTLLSRVAEMRTWVGSSKLSLKDNKYKAEVLNISGPWHREVVGVNMQSHRGIL